MNTSMQIQLAKLAEMSTGELAQRYAELFGEPTRTRHKAYLIRKIAWRMTNDGAAFRGSDTVDLFLTGKALRELLDELS